MQAIAKKGAVHTWDAPMAEMAPSLQPRTEAPHTTSTMMMTVPFPEGDEQYLVVSDTTSVPNPILAYKRTTSSH